MRCVLLLVALSVVVTGCKKKEDDRDEDGVPDASDCAPDDAAYAEEQTWQRDRDGDGYGVNSVSCEPPAEVVDLAGDCNDNDADVHPEADELCNDRDEDCDGDVDESAVDAIRWSRDNDGDGYGSVSGVIEVCEPPFGFVSEGGDCNDTDVSIRPGVDEICDGIDEDCDGAVDDDPIGAPRWYRDADRDGYGTTTDAVNECAEPEGYLAVSGDCDDADAWLHPGAVEYCNGYDDDCDGLLDKEDPDEAGDATWYLDADGDGWGTPDSTTTACALPSGYARFDLDCDDTTDAISPDAAEVCLNGVDDDCDGAALGCGEEGEAALLDEAFATWAAATDQEFLGFGAAVTAVGDWSDDGAPELAFGAQGAAFFTGAVYFAEGGSAGGSTSELTALTGAVGNDYFGYALAPLGDADGDGVSDVLIGAPGAVGLSGEVYLVRGPVTASGVVTTAAAATLVGPAGAQAGYAVASAGDQDADGFADLLIGAPQADGAGRVYLLSGTVTGSNALGAGLASVSGAAGEAAGWSASAGDLTGDGIWDVAVGAPYDASATGQGWVFEGPLAGDLTTADGTALYAEQTGSGATIAMDLRGDYDGDGYADLAIGASTWDDAVTADSGRVYVIFGPIREEMSLADADALFDGELGATCGASVSWAGSPNGDDVDDLVIGCPTAWDATTTRGAAALVYGGFGPGSYALASTGRRWLGGADFDSAGGGVGPAGDQDGDGVDDLLIASPYASTGAAYAGQVSVVLGASAF